MSEEVSKGDQIMELEEAVATLQMANAELSYTMSQVQREMDALRSQVSTIETSATATAMAPAAAACGACGSNPISFMSEEGFTHERKSAVEEAIGVLKVSNAELVEKMTEMQRTVDEQRVSLEDLRASNANLKASNAELTNRIEDLEISDVELRKMMAGSSQLSTPTSISIEGLSGDLYNAASEGNAQRIRQLVAKGANFEYRDECGYTPLHRAAYKGHVDALTTLVELGAPLEAQDGETNTPLFYAVMREREVCVNVLVSAGANVNARNKDRETPLHYAAATQSRAIVEMLIAANADREAKDSNGNIPKEWAWHGAINELF